jgi:hypothetical protein
MLSRASSLVYGRRCLRIDRRCRRGDAQLSSGDEFEQRLKLLFSVSRPWSIALTRPPGSLDIGSTISIRSD